MPDAGGLPAVVQALVPCLAASMETVWLTMGEEKNQNTLCKWYLAGVLACMGWLLVAAVHAQPAPVLVLGTPRPDGNYGGVLLRRIYQELFHRLSLVYEIRTLPTARLALELAAGHIDGDLTRPWAFADSQPTLIRIDEPVIDIAFALWTVNPNIVLNRLDDLAGSGYSVNFTRGVTECEKSLQTWLPPSRVSDVTTTVSALNMLHYGRNDLHCGADLAVLSDAGVSEFAGRPPPVKLVSIGKPLSLYLYLQNKHAALVPQLVATLKKMKADGTMDRLRKETLREYNLPYTP